MKRTLIIVTALSLSACGKSAGVSSASSSGTAQPAAVASTTTTTSTTTNPAGSTTTPTTPVISIPGITAADIASITSVLGQLAGTIFNNLSLGSISTNGTQQENITKTISCPGGGTAAFAAQGSLAVNMGFPQTTATLSGASSSITFTNCVLDPASGPSVEVNGTASVASGQGNVSAPDLGGTFTAQGSDQISGNVQVTVSSVTTQCSLTLSNTNNASGTLNLLPFSANASVTASISGTVCGQAVNQSVQAQEKL